MLLCALLVLVTLPLAAQERFGNVAGVVKDPSGAVLPEVTVTVKNKATNRTFTTTSRADGTFLAPEVEPGRYSAVFEKTGFTTNEVPDILVLVGKTTTVDVAMKVGSAKEIVEVTGAAAAIDTSSTMVAHNVTIEELDRLPKGRTFEAVAIFSPSVNTGAIEGGYQINGASGAENGVYIDGVPVTSIIDGSARQTSTFDYLQEVQVKTTGLDAEYGGALGGVVSAITKSGGNTFHGDLHYYYYGNKTSAGPVKRIQIDGNPAFADPSQYRMSYFQDDKMLNDNHEIGGSLGGPIVKDKLWFYTAASPKWQQRRNEYLFTEGYTGDCSTPGSTTCVPVYDPGSMRRRAHQMNWFSKLSYDPTSRIRTNFTYLYTPQYVTGQLYAYSGFAPNVTTNTKQSALDNRERGYNQAENSVTGQVDFAVTNSSLLSVKAGRYYLNYKDTGVPFDHQYVWRTAEYAPDVPAELQLSEGAATASGARVFHDLTTRTYIQADYAHSVPFAGQHNFKFGIGTTKNVNNVMDSWNGALGRVNLYWGQSSGGYSGTYGYYTVDDAWTNGSAGSNITHLYVQDSWKVLNRLTVNAGVRFEKETIPSFRPDVQKYALQFGFGDKVAPRIGASFDLFGDGKVKISGGYGRYFDWTKYDLPRGTFGGDKWLVYYRTLDSADPDFIYSINLNNMPGFDIWNARFGEPARDRRIPGFDTLDPDVKPMSSESLNVGVEWEILKDMVFTGRYVRSNLIRTIEDMGVLIAGSEAYFYGNPGEGANRFAPASGASCPTTLDGVCAVPMPKAKRTYDAMELSVGRRFSSGWLFNASYVYSRLWGNYAGLQSTDEIRPSTLGYGFGANQVFGAQIFRPGGNANRYFDLDEAYYDAHGNNGLYGRLPTDRPHVFKFYGAKTFKFGTEVGGFFRASSGTPVTTQVDSQNQIPIYVNGRGDMGRTPVFSQTDLLVAHELKLGKDEAKRLRFEVNMINLFNQKTNVFTFDRYNREEHSDATGMDLSGVDLTQGFDYKALVAASGNDLDPRYGQAAEFNQGFQARFLIKFIF
ncbi:MAG: carboxypeptidase regulatory-like domain-containing protein [Terriglobales bacterium]